jgi:hypothetical protein
MFSYTYKDKFLANHDPVLLTRPFPISNVAFLRTAETDYFFKTMISC